MTVVRGPAGIGKTHYARHSVDPVSSVWVTLRSHRHATELAAHLDRRLRMRLAALPPGRRTVATSVGSSTRRAGATRGPAHPRAPRACRPLRHRSALAMRPGWSPVTGAPRRAARTSPPPPTPGSTVAAGPGAPRWPSAPRTPASDRAARPRSARPPRSGPPRAPGTSRRSPPGRPAPSRRSPAPGRRPWPHRRPPRAPQAPASRGSAPRHRRAIRAATVRADGSAGGPHRVSHRARSAVADGSVAVCRGSCRFHRGLPPRHGSRSDHGVSARFTASG